MFSLTATVKGWLNRYGLDVVRCPLMWRGSPVRETIPDLTDDELRIARHVEPFTATSLARVVGLIRAVRYVVRCQIPGDIVECGVWRGGSTMAAALTLIEAGETSRNLYLFDTFEGMTPPTEKDKDAAGNTASQILDATPHQTGVWCFAAQEEVRKNLATTGYPADRLHFIKGRVEETLPCPVLREISVLRLDTDWYESTRHELQHLYPLLATSGVLIIDDYGDWQGAKLAVDEFLQQPGGPPLLMCQLDRTGRIAVKTAGSSRTAKSCGVA